MNVKLLRQVKRHILEKPKRLNMGYWSMSAKRMVREGRITKEVEPACGTVGCIAGWAVILTKTGKRTDFLATMKRIRGHNSEVVMQPLAKELLDLSEYSANRLFLTSNWPGSFEQDYLYAMTPKQRARVTPERIEHFIRTNGEE